MTRIAFGAVLTASLLAVSGARAGVRADTPATRPAAQGQPQKIDLLLGEGKPFPWLRIPSLVVTPKGTVLAICIQQKTSSDNSAADVILCRSTDGGRSFSEPVVIASDHPNSANDPCTVVDHRTGRVFVFFVQFKPGYHTYDAPPGYTDPNRSCLFVLHSDDDGVTWSKPKDVSESLKRPTVSGAVSAPGMGIQLRRGPHAGRLVAPMWQCEQRRFATYMAYSDDAGETWKMGELIALPDGKQCNESQVVERSDGSLLVSARPVGGGPRWTAVSADGGVTWTQVQRHPQLTDPGCMASILRHSDPLDGKKSILLHSNPDSEKGRKNGTIRVSYDEGKTWPVSKVLDPGYYGYSALAVLPDGTILCMYESTGTKHMVLARFPLEWLSGGEDR